MLASQPYFSSSFAGLSCVVFTLVFVGSLYVFPIKNTASGSRSNKSTLENEDRNGERSVLDRNHPLVIQQRCKGILLSCVVIPIYLWVAFSAVGVLSPDLRTAACDADRDAVCFGSGAVHGPVADDVAGSGVALSGTVPMGAV
ncbi:hypothetical protein BGZ68_005206 [Mortierella alpina]|nr:hypothetical protein BGZ68_005206 [Mortierella alpina]